MGATSTKEAGLQQVRPAGGSRAEILLFPELLRIVETQGVPFEIPINETSFQIDHV